MADSSAETLQARREWHDILNMMKGKNLQPRILYTARLSFRFEGEIKSLQTSKSQDNSAPLKPALQQILKELLWAEKKRPQPETKISQMTRLTSKSIYTVKIQNHPRTIMPPKSEIMRRGGYKCRTLKMNLQLREQQLKTISYRLLYQNFRITTNQKSTIDTQTKKNQFKYNTKDGHQTTREENKRRREEKRATKTNPKQLIKWQ